MLARVRHIAVKEARQALRDPRMKAVILVAPVLQLLVFGYAVSTDVRDIPTAVYDLDRSATSREFVARLSASGHFRLVAFIDDEESACAMLDRAEASVVVRLPRGFERDVGGGGAARIQLVLDGTDSTTASVVMGYAAGIGARFAENVAVERLARLGARASRPGTIRPVSRAWFNENLESRVFFVPGVIALIVTLVTLLLTSMAVVREKEVGTIEQIMVSPIRPFELIAGKTVPFLAVAFIDVVTVLTVGVLLFDVPVRGSLVLLFAGIGLYVMTTLGVGLLISTVSRTQQQAMMTVFFFFLPAMLLSGFAFPISNMPRVVQLVTYLDPIRYILVVVRGVLLKGVGVAVLWPQLLALAALGTATLAFATLRFRKSLG
jgi:ABC-2 type transport system permease protein